MVVNKGQNTDVVLKVPGKWGVIISRKMGNKRRYNNTPCCNIENIQFNIVVGESQSKNINEELKLSEKSVAAREEFIIHDDIEVTIAANDNNINNSPTTEEQFQCPKLNCSEINIALNDSKNHFSVNAKFQETAKSRIIKVSAKHPCSYPGCKEIFSRPWRLAAHESLHTGKKPFACSVEDCDKSYSSSTHLKRHIDNVHRCQPRIITEYWCPANGCNKFFRSTQSVKKHYKLLHSEKADDTCPYKSQSCNDALQTVRCLEKPKVETWQGNLSDNTAFKKRRRKQKKEYSCEEHHCHKVFPNLLLLRKHVKSDHPFCAETMCYICNKNFASKTNLKCHLKTHLAPSQRKQFDCPYEDCSRHYTTKFNLQQHISSKHVGKKFSCMYAECMKKKFSTKQKLQEHLKRHLLPSYSEVKKGETTRRKRKDAGLPKRSMAVKLSGVQIPYHIEKSILDRERMDENSEHKKSDDEWDASMSGIFEEALHHFDLSKCASETVIEETRGKISSDRHRTL